MLPRNYFENYTVHDTCYTCTLYLNIILFMIRPENLLLSIRVRVLEMWRRCSILSKWMLSKLLKQDSLKIKEKEKWVNRPP